MSHAFSLFVSEQNDISYLMDEEAVLAAKMMQMVGYLSEDRYKIMFNKPNTQEFVDKALLRGYTIYLKDSEGNKIGTATPGNAVDVQELLELPVQASTLMMMYKEGETYFAFIVDNFNLRIGYFQFHDDDNFNHLQSCIIHNRIMEIIYDKSDEQLSRICEEYQVKFSPVSRSLFKEGNFENLDSEFKKLATATEAYQSCRISDFVLYPYTPNELLKLDIYAIRALHVFADDKKTPCLYNILNTCVTSMGSRLLKNWLRQPCNRIEQIERRLDIVEACGSCEQLDGLVDALKKLTDIPRFARKMDKQTIKLQELWTINGALEQVDDVMDTLEHYENIKVYFVEDLKSSMFELLKFRSMISDNILYDANQHKCRINPSAMESLKTLDEEMKESMSLIEQDFEKIRSSMGGLDKLSIEKHPKFGFCLWIPKSKASTLKKKAGVIELSSLKNQSYFTTSNIQSASKDLKRLETEYLNDSEQIMDQMKIISKQYSKNLFSLSELLAQIDVFCALGEAARLFNYSRPSFNNDKQCIIKNGYHPSLQMSPDVIAIPNDCDMIRDSTNAQIITGFNVNFSHLDWW
eukprot:NODE_628_length_5237_cov_0.539510.p1 type:complete len:578 gc:universal NODE_628_length_5237_cov_0.539510:4621-2888(-)